MRGLGFLVWGGGGDGLGTRHRWDRLVGCGLHESEIALEAWCVAGMTRGGARPVPTVIPRDSTGPFSCVCGFAGVAALGRLA
jgi:hypothetical protein